MPLINCKVKLKLKSTKYWVLFANGNDNDNNNNNNNNNNIFTIKDTNFYVPVVTLLARDNQIYLNFLAKDLKDQFNRINIKQKVRIKIEQMNIDILFNQILLDSIHYLF